MIVGLGYILGLVFLVLSQTSSLFVMAYSVIDGGAYYCGPIHHVFLIFFLFYSLGFLLQLIKFCIRVTVSSERNYVMYRLFTCFLVVGPFAYLRHIGFPLFSVFIAVIPFIFFFVPRYVYTNTSDFDELLIMKAKDVELLRF